MEVKRLSLPKIPEPAHYPSLTVEETSGRYQKLHQLMDVNDLSHVAIYGDREHFGNLAYVTGGYDSRFEETLLLVAKDESPLLIVGNEGGSYSDISLLKHQKELFQTFSLQGQTRDRKVRLHDILRAHGIDRNSNIGIVGAKYFELGETEDPSHTFDVPHYVVEEIRQLTPIERIRNVTHLFTHPSDGLRTVLSEHEIARFEYAASYLSEQMRKVLHNLRVGMNEAELAGSFEYRGLPFSAHPVVSFGDKAVLLGLASPNLCNRLHLGDSVNVAFGVQGANIARTGIAVFSADDFAGPRRNILEDFYYPYFEAMKGWYETLTVGQRSRHVYESVMRIVGNNRFGVSLNPGHQIHLEEWINSPFRSDHDYPIRSGAALQCDIIAFPGGAYVGVHVEDSLVVADSDLRERLRKTYPSVMDRIGARQEMMRDLLGISISDDVLPLSNLQAVLHPFLLDPELVLTAT